MGEWETCQIGEIANLIQGLAINAQSKHLILNNDKGLPLLRIKDLLEDNQEIFIDEENVPSSCIAETNDLIFTRTGQVGFVFMGKKGVVHNNCFRIVPKDNKLHLPFLYNYLNRENVRDYLDNISAGSVQSDMTHGIFKTVEIPLPPLPEQKAIASVLSSLDDKIDLLHCQNKTLETMAETLFRQWFVEGAKEEWEENIITELFEIRDGTHDSPKQSLVGKPLITSKHIGTNRLDIKNAYLISEDDFYNINKRSKVETNDLLFSMIGTIGLTYLEQSETVDYAIKNIGLFKTSQNPDWCYYTFLWINSSLGKEFIHEHRSGSTQEYIALGSLRSIVFDAPPLELLLEFNEVIHTYFQKIKNNMLQIRTLEKLRDTLLPKLMSGKVRVAL